MGQALEPVVSNAWQFTLAQQAWDLQGDTDKPLSNSDKGFLRRARERRSLSSHIARSPSIRLCVRIGPEGELIPLSSHERILNALTSFGDIAATAGWLQRGWPRL